MPMCSEGHKREDLICPNCGKSGTVTQLNGAVMQCCGVLGGCGFCSLNESDFKKKQAKL